MNIIRIKSNHYEEMLVTVAIKVTNFWTGKVEEMEAKGRLIKHIEDPELVISFN